MATRFVELNEAAKMLGLTPDQLVEMRSSGAIHGYRDGASWKFKIEEIERVAAERGTAKKGGTKHEDDLIPFDDDVDLEKPAKTGRHADEEGSILVSEEELGQSGEGSSSTVIGKTEKAARADSDLPLGPVPDTDLTLAASPPVDSDVTLVPGAGIDSDVSLVPDTGSDREVGKLSDSKLELKSGSSGGTGRLEGLGSDLSLGSDIDVSLDSGLALSDDDEMVLGGSSGAGSDLTLGAADSGINLGSPSDSGLSLEADSGISLQSPTDSGLSLDDQPLETTDSHTSGLELPEDEEVLGLAEERPAPKAAVKKDEEFSLTPSDDMFGDESDSGSQVIALEDSAAFDQDTALIEPAGEALLTETAGLEQQLESIGAGAGPMARPLPGVGYMAAEALEAPYSIWNVMGLLLIVLLLSISGIMLTDIVQNLWAWDSAHDVSTGISSGISSAIFK